MPVTGDPVISFPGWELQKDEYSILSGDSAISNLGCAVHNFPPESPSFPYLIMGRFTTTPDYHKSGALWVVTSTIHHYDEYKGTKSVYQIFDAVVQALTGGSFSLTGFTIVAVEAETGSEPLEEIDAGGRVIFHYIHRMRYLIS